MEIMAVTWMTALMIVLTTSTVIVVSDMIRSFMIWVVMLMIFTMMIT